MKVKQKLKNNTNNFSNLHGHQEHHGLCVLSYNNCKNEYEAKSLYKSMVYTLVTFTLVTVIAEQHKQHWQSRQEKHLQSLQRTCIL